MPLNFRMENEQDPPEAKPIPLTAYNKIVAATYWRVYANPTIEPNWLEPALVVFRKVARGPVKEKWLWSGGPSYMEIPPTARVLKVYSHDPKDDRAWSEAERQIRKDWPYLPDTPWLEFVNVSDKNPLGTFIGPEGFISPEGNWYQIAFMLHESMARRLNRQLYDDLEEPERGTERDRLMRRGWIDVRREYIAMSDPNGKPSVAQERAMRSLLAVLMTRQDHPAVVVYTAKFLASWNARFS